MINSVFKEDIATILNESLDWNIFKNKTVMVTGANGFIPFYIAATFLELKNVKVIAVVRNEEKAKIKFKEYLNDKNLELVVHDISFPFDYNKKIDFIIHAASQASPKYYGIDPVGTLKANSLGTSYLLDLAVKHNVEKFIYISIGEIYGKLNDNIENIKENYCGEIDCTDIRSCYSESKRMGENMCVCYSKQYNIPVNILRLAHIYGPGISLDDGRVFADFVKNILNNENIVINSDGSAKRCFLYITDMIKALFYIIFYGKNAEAYNIASNQEVSILELANILIDLYPEKRLKVEFNKNICKSGYIKSKSSRIKLNTDKLKNLGWNESVNIKTGFKRMVKSYNNNILITGTGGFIGKNLKEYLKDKYELLCPRSSELDLCNENAVKEYFNNNKIDFIIHCATVGGVRGVEDKSSTVDENLAMVNNLIAAKKESTRMIVFGSGAIYDRKRNLHKVKEEEIGEHIPKELYGLSKLKIWESVKNRDDVLCLNIFGCYGYDEKETRFPSYAIQMAIRGKDITINKNSTFDYLWIEDLCKIIEFFIPHKPEDNMMNITPTESVSLEKIAEIVKEISKKDIKINVNDNSFEYTGDNSKLVETYNITNNETSNMSESQLRHTHTLEFTPIEEGLKKLYDYILSKELCLK